MACEKPLIITTGCNFPEVEKENTGWICEADHDSLETALNRALNTNSNTLVSMGQSGRDLVKRKYTWAKIASTIIEATNELKR
jgi:glycosyltransferase involved in cell wall biosynthesis